MSVPVVLLTGASGFVGGHMSAAAPCVALVDSDGVEVDVRSRDRVLKALAKLRFDAVVHLAAQPSVTASFEDPETTYSVNFSGTFNLLWSLKQMGFTGRLLYVGTSEEYGEVDETCLPVSERQPLRPRSPYAVSKVAAEALCYQWSQMTTPVTMLPEKAIVQATVHVDDGLGQPRDQRRMVRDNMKLRKATGWKPSIPVQQTLDDVVRDWEGRVT